MPRSKHVDNASRSKIRNEAKHTGGELLPKKSKAAGAAEAKAPNRERLYTEVLKSEVNVVTNLTAAITKVGEDIQAGAFNFHMECPSAVSPVFNGEDMAAIHRIIVGAGFPTVAQFFGLLDAIMPDVEEKFDVSDGMLSTPAGNHIRHCILHAVVKWCVWHYDNLASLFGPFAEN